MNDVTLSQGALRGRGTGPLAGSTALIVLGMHRSGTSAMAGMLHHLGIAFGTRLMAATAANPRGYWEHVDVVNVHQTLMAELGYGWDDIRPLPLGWCDSVAANRARAELSAILARDFAGSAIWGVKDPRLCRLTGLWAPLLDEAMVEPRFVLALRDPYAVAASLRVRDKLEFERAALLWLRHILEAERGTRGRRRSIVRYEELIAGSGWRAAAARIANDLNIVWPDPGPAAAAALDRFLSAELRHHAGAVSAEYGAAAGWLEAVYTALVSGEAGLGSVCDAVARELDHAERLFLPLVTTTTTITNTDQLTRAEHEAAELRAVLTRRELELNLLKRFSSTAGRNTRAVGLLPAEDAYPQWLESRATTALARPEWVAERVASWPRLPKLALGMVVPAGNEARVAATLISLLKQTIGTWRLYVVAEGPTLPAYQGEPRLTWLQAAGALFESLNPLLAASEADWVALIDAGDQLAPHALFSLGDALFRHPEWGAAYSDEDRIDLNGVRSAPHFKPDFNLDLLRSMPYVGGLLAVRREVFAAIGGFDPRWDGGEDYDIALRLAERLDRARFGHIADVLYHRLTSSGRSRRAVAELCADMPRIVQAHLDRAGVSGSAEPGAQPYFCRVRYRHDGPEPLVSIVVPTRDQLPLLKRCVETVLEKTEYQNYELIIVDNGSSAADACAYLDNIESKLAEIGSRIRVLRHPGPFNFSAMNNRAVREEARGDYICLLNNDAAPLDGGWLGEMMALARRPEVGVVGAKLYYADGRIQHAGVVLGVGFGAPAEHPFIGDPGNSFGFWGRLMVEQEYSAVTGACLLTRRSLYEAVGGLDEEVFEVAFNDIDYCLKVGAAGYKVVWTPFARLLHDGSASLKKNVERRAAEERHARLHRERLAMFRRWMPQIAYDPAYNRNLSSLGYGFSIETEGAPTWDPELRPRPRVLAYPADREGCGEYRIIAPSRALFKAGRVHSFETMRLATPPELARIAPEAVVFQRQLEWHQIAFIEQIKQTSTTLRIFELDDLITNLPPKSVHRKTIAPDIGDRLKKAVGLCDRLVVSTAPLARAYGRFCDEVVVLPNRLEAARWAGLEPTRREGGKPRVGWAGAVGHTGDLALLAPVVKATAREVDWVFFGMCPDDLRRHVAEVHDWVPLRDYAAKLASLDLDLAVAPLEPHPFNEAKSNLRLLEYGILGYPVVCSDIVPYQCDLPVTRLASRPGLWIKTIREMASDRDACRLAGGRLREAVLAGWMLEDHLDEWASAWLP